MPKKLTIEMSKLRECGPCADSWKYMSRMFPNTLHLDQFLERLISERVAGTSPSMVALDWGFWGLRVWTSDPKVEANARVLAKHILNHTSVYVGDRDKHVALSMLIADLVLNGQADDEIKAKAQELRALYEQEDVRPPVYFALGSNVGEFISDLALSAFFYAGVARTDLILHYEGLLLAFAKHDHDQPFEVRS